MAWIESHQELGRHPKTRKLARLLNISRVCVVGHLQFLWWWALDYAQDGDLSRFDADEIAEAAEWEDDAILFVESLISAGFIDLDDDGAQSLHDWYDCAGKLIDRRVANAERMRAARAAQNTKPLAHVSNTTASRASHVQRTFVTRAGATEQNPTEHNTTHTSAAAASAAKAADNIVTLPVASAPGGQPSDADALKADAGEAKPMKSAAAKARAVNPLWDALVAEFYDPQTKPEKSNFGKLVGELKEVGATPADVHQRCANHHKMREREQLRWDLTPNALLSHWTELDHVAPVRLASANARQARPATPTPAGMDGALIPSPFARSVASSTG